MIYSIIILVIVLSIFFTYILAKSRKKYLDIKYNKNYNLILLESTTHQLRIQKELVKSCECKETELCGEHVVYKRLKLESKQLKLIIEDSTERIRFNLWYRLFIKKDVLTTDEEKAINEILNDITNGKK